MVSSSQDRCPHRFVTVDKVDGKWVVTIVEDEARAERSFDFEAFARSYADGQRHRLGLSLPDRAACNPDGRGTIFSGDRG